MTEDDVRKIIAEYIHPQSRIDDQTWQWLVRYSFELAWRKAKASADTTADDWLAAWIDSEPRDILLRNGFITGSEGYK